jgi:hypothetical protein
VRRGARRGALAALALAGGVALAACSSGSSSLARQACTDVSRSVQLFNEAEHQTGAARTRLLNQANVELRTAVPDAGLAAGTDTDYQALAATLSESDRVPEGDLVQALIAQCQAVDST